MANRDRASGWKHAKISGHKNEDNIVLKFNNRTLFEQFSARLSPIPPISIQAGGIHEKRIPSILEDPTPSKTDLVLFLEKNMRINISLKKSEGGQVFLIKSSRFIQGIEKQNNIAIPQKVIKAISLFWGEDRKIDQYIKEYGVKDNKDIYDYENRKKRLVAVSMNKLSEGYNEALLDWFKKSIRHITLFCFSQGLAKNSSEWADYLWYRNTLHENSLDELFEIEQLAKKCEENIEAISFGKRLGGTTINLPFGFVQWHQKQMQFHHSYKKIKALFP